MQKARVWSTCMLAIAGCCCLGSVGIATALPPGRHYEMVSPVFKGGFGATLPRGGQSDSAVSSNGESITFFSPGVFDEAPSASGSGRGRLGDYYASRQTLEWTTSPLVVPSSLSNNPWEDISPDLSLQLAIGPPTTHEYELQEGLDTWVRPTTQSDVLEAWQDPTSIASTPNHEMALEYVGGSSDLCHALMVKVNGNGVEPVAEADGTAEQAYDVSRGCHGTTTGIRLVGVNNEEPAKLIDHNQFESGSSCHVSVGNVGLFSKRQSSDYNAVNADGSDVYFNACTGEGERHQLFVRLGGERTLEVSRPLETGAFGGCVGESGRQIGEVPCEGASTRASADFVGASEDGSRVYFTATLESGEKPLVEGDADASSNLYVATIDCPLANPGCAAPEREVTSLTEASHDPNSGEAEVQGVLRVAPNGKRVYFVATGDLLSSKQQQALEGRGSLLPQVGAENLYVYDVTSNVVSFVADLCTGTERSGTKEDFHCPFKEYENKESDSPLWSEPSRQTSGESQTGGPGGEFLVFSTYAQLSAEDTNSARDVYRYDALTGALTRVSHGENGFEPNGSEATVGAQIAEGHRGGSNVLEDHELDVRAISEDGSRIVFTSAEPLSPLDTNGVVNAYEWHEGAVSLVSTGGDPERVNDVVISGNGTSVAFDTTASLVPRDTDVLSDVYVARLGEDFPARPAEREPCETGCQGPLTIPAPLLVPGTVSQVPDQSVTTTTTTPAAKPKPRPKCKRNQVRNKHGKCVKRGHKARRSGNKSNRRGRS